MLTSATLTLNVRRIHASGRIASKIGVEGGGQIDNSLAVLRTYHDLGAGYLTLTHVVSSAWADSATDDPRHGGLTWFGEAVVGREDFDGHEGRVAGHGFVGFVAGEDGNVGDAVETVRADGQAQLGGGENRESPPQG